MKHLMLSSLLVLLIAATGPTLRAQTTALNPTTLNSASTAQLTPFNLVNLARRGYFQQQGIPSYLAFTSAYNLGRIHAAVKANRLSTDFLTDQKYLTAVEAQLQEQENIH